MSGVKRGSFLERTREAGYIIDKVKDFVESVRRAQSTVSYTDFLGTVKVAMTPL
jgi:hypothetical protein